MLHTHICPCSWRTRETSLARPLRRSLGQSNFHAHRLGCGPSHVLQDLAAILYLPGRAWLCLQSQHHASRQGPHIGDTNTNWRMTYLTAPSACKNNLATELLAWGTWARAPSGCTRIPTHTCLMWAVHPARRRLRLVALHQLWHIAHSMPVSANAAAWELVEAVIHASGACCALLTHASVWSSLPRRSFTHTLCKLQDPCCVQFPRPFKRERPQTSNAKMAVSRSSDVPRLIDLSHCASERTTQDQSTTLAFGQYGTRATKSLDTCSLAASPNGRLQQF